MTELPVKTARFSLPRLRFWRRAGAAPRRAAIVPAESVAGNALVMVIAIMTFLAALTIGALDMVRAAVADWDSAVASQVTIQIMPAPGRDLDAAVRQASQVARSVPGIADVAPLSAADVQRLLAPWLGSNVRLGDLPVPRLIAVRVVPGAHPDLGALSARLTKEVAGASLDDHRAWIQRLRAVGGTLVGICAGVLALVVAATALSVLFATRGAMSGNRDIIEVLHVVGARDGFIARAFARRFFAFGLKGGVVGGGLAMLLFFVTGWLRAGADTAALLGNAAVTPYGYAAIAFAAALIALLTAATSRIAVMAHLKRLD
jgi:cell division transport system permease protein